MSELMRFRRARPARRMLDLERDVYRVLRPDETPTPLLAAIRQGIDAPIHVPGEYSETAARRARLAKLGEATQGKVPDSAPLQPLLRFLYALDVALLRFDPAPKPAALSAALAEVLTRRPLDLPGTATEKPEVRLTKHANWTPTRRYLGDLLVLLHLGGRDSQRGEGPQVAADERTTATTAMLNRLLLLQGLVEYAAAGALAKSDADDVAHLLFQRSVLLPSPPFPLQVHAPLLAATRFARRPAVVDLTVVREEWCCYVPGEIAHVENVLKGESKTRTHRQLDEREITDARDDDSLTVREDGSVTTERESFQEETQREVALTVGVEGQVDVSGSYGPMQIATHVGASVQLGYSQAERRASEQAREVIDRVLDRREARVRRIRTERTLRRTEEKNVHTIDNATAPTGHVVGIYRWVDKILRLRDFVYPQRYALEFQLAEPGARLRWLRSRRAPVAPLTPPPPPFTMSVAGGIKDVSPEWIDRTNYLPLVAKFRATGIADPPLDVLAVAGAIELQAEEQMPGDTFNHIHHVPRAVGKAELTVPPGYIAASLRATLAGVPQLGAWRDSPEQGGDFFQDLVGYHAILATVSAGGARLDLRSGTSTVVTGALPGVGIEMPDIWEGRAEQRFTAETPVPDSPTQQLTVAATAAGTFDGHITVSLMCSLTAAAYDEWRLGVYERLLAAHQSWQARYDDEVRAQQVADGIGIGGDSPARKRERIQEEIRRQVIELMIGQDFDGYPLLRGSPDGVRGPSPEFARLGDAAATIQFLEQAFEWHNLSYVAYPFYWSDRTGWPALEELRDDDPTYERFLRSGSARVVVPARPGYEYAIEYYAAFGEPWSGGAAPTPDDPLYVSVAQEIRELTGGGERGVPGDLWETRQPTTLVWLDPSPAMPKRNEYASDAFDGTPDPQLCPTP
jgi:hypothetical protein